MLDVRFVHPEQFAAYLEAGGTLENVQAMAAHKSPRTSSRAGKADQCLG